MEYKLSLRNRKTCCFLIYELIYKQGCLYITCITCILNAALEKRKYKLSKKFIRMQYVQFKFRTPELQFKLLRTITKVHNIISLKETRNSYFGVTPKNHALQESTSRFFK